MPRRNDAACKNPAEKGWPSCYSSPLPAFKWASLTLVVVHPHDQRCSRRTAVLALMCFQDHWYHDSTTEWVFHPRSSSEDNLQDGPGSSIPSQDFSNQLWRTAFSAAYHKPQLYCSYETPWQFSRRHQLITKPSSWKSTVFSCSQAVQLLRQTWHKKTDRLETEFWFGSKTSKMFPFGYKSLKKPNVEISFSLPNTL